MQRPATPGKLVGNYVAGLFESGTWLRSALFLALANGITRVKGVPCLEFALDVRP
jgi:hypothetical protein